LTFSKFNCPDCPTCPPQKDCSLLYPPNNNEIIRYINKHIITELEDTVDGVKFLNENVIFANNVKVKFEADSESVLSKMRTEIIDNKKNISKENLTYVQTFDKVKIDDFKTQFNISEYPSPLIVFNNTDILFGWIESKSKWMMLINKDKY
tara:strand:- start:87 stop:536 length:450 start_codon:yes stop_codon:yes gene_type:complete